MTGGFSSASRTRQRLQVSATSPARVGSSIATPRIDPPASDPRMARIAMTRQIDPAIGITGSARRSDPFYKKFS
jgi:hypothetical protein